MPDAGEYKGLYGIGAYENLTRGCMAVSLLMVQQADAVAALPVAIPWEWKVN